MLDPEPPTGALLLATQRCIDHALTMRVMNKELIKLKGCEIQADDHVDGQILTSAARILFHTACRCGRENTAVACLDLFHFLGRCRLDTALVDFPECSK